MKCAFNSRRVGDHLPHTLHLNVRGSFVLRIVIVLVLNPPLADFSDFGLTNGALSSTSSVASGGAVLRLVASGGTTSVASGSSVSSGTVNTTGFSVASVSVLLSTF